MKNNQNKYDRFKDKVFELCEVNDSTKFLWNKKAYSKHGHNVQNWEFVGFSFEFDAFLAAHMLCEKKKKLCKHWITFLRKLGVGHSNNVSGTSSESIGFIRGIVEEFEKQIKYSKT